MDCALGRGEDALAKATFAEGRTLRSGVAWLAEREGEDEGAEDWKLGALAVPGVAECCCWRKKTRRKEEDEEEESRPRAFALERRSLGIQVGSELSTQFLLRSKALSVCKQTMYEKIPYSDQPVVPASERPSNDSASSQPLSLSNPSPQEQIAKTSCLHPIQNAFFLS